MRTHLTFFTGVEKALCVQSAEDTVGNACLSTLIVYNAHCAPSLLLTARWIAISRVRALSKGLYIRISFCASVMRDQFDGNLIGMEREGQISRDLQPCWSYRRRDSPTDLSRSFHPPLICGPALKRTITIPPRVGGKENLLLCVSSSSFVLRCVGVGGIFLSSFHAAALSRPAFLSVPVTVLRTS